LNRNLTPYARKCYSTQIIMPKSKIVKELRKIQLKIPIKTLVYGD